LRFTRSIVPGLAVLALTASSTASAASVSPRRHTRAVVHADGSGGAGFGTSTTGTSGSSGAPAPATTGPGSTSTATGVTGTTTPATHPTVAGSVAKIIKGVAYAPSDAPLAVQRAIWAGNQIRLKPYAYGGGHGSFKSSGYDCSGSVSYLLHGGGLLKTPMDSSDFESYGSGGVGQWITVYTNPGHAFVEIAGIRLDTSSAGDPNGDSSGPRWRPLLSDTSGFDARHPANL
jgi:hypothetical protein